MKRKVKSKPTKPCGRCGAEAPRLYRVVVEKDGAWVFVCDDCWPSVSEDNPHYHYGGTWTGRDRG
ncbi:MAG: hypothetical protein AAGI17_02985 [Planctomycetota bacterium]